MNILDTIDEIGKQCNVGLKHVGPTALSALTDVQIGGTTFLLDFPSDAKTILAVMPTLTSPAGNTANEPLAASVSLSSTSSGFNLGDCTFLCQPIGSSLLKAVAQIQGSGQDVVYPIFAPIPTGGKLKILARGLFDHTIEPYVGLTIWFCDQLLDPAIYPQRHWILGTYTNTGTTAAEATDATKIGIVGGRRIVEVGGFAVGTTVAALKGLCTWARLTSPDLLTFGDIEFFLNPSSGQVDTNIQEANAGVTRLPCSVPIKSPANITDKMNLAVALTTTGNFVIQIGYI